MFTEWILPNSWQLMVNALANVLHRRSAWRLHLIMNTFCQRQKDHYQLVQSRLYYPAI